MKISSLALALIPLLVLACDEKNKSSDAEPAASAETDGGDDKEPGADADDEDDAPALTTETVSMGGVKWTVGLVEGMKAPQYEVKNPEYLGPDDMKVKLDGTFPSFESADSYIKRNVATEVLEKEEHGEATFIVAKPQSKGTFTIKALVPGKKIGWWCSGDEKREQDLRAMCRSVKFEMEG